MSGLTKLVLVTAGMAIYQAYRRSQDRFTYLAVRAPGIPTEDLLKAFEDLGASRRRTQGDAR